MKGSSRLGYMPRRSFVHRLDPLTKLTVLLCCATLAVTLTSELASLALLAFILLAYLGAGLNPLGAARRLRSLLGFILLIAAVQILFNPQGTTLLYLIPPLAPGLPPLLPLTTGALGNALLLSLRLINIILASALFVAATDPTLLAVALTRLRIPYRYCFLLVLTLRLLPLFEQEAATIRDAQRTRGIPLDRGAIRSLPTRIRYTLHPLLVSALSRVDTITLAMDGRGFGYAKTRTYLRRPKFTHQDALITILAITLTSIILWHQFLLAPFPRLFT